MYGGVFYVSNVFDIDNNVVDSGIIWENQPFYYASELWYGGFITFFISCIRFFIKCFDFTQKQYHAKIHRKETKLP
jgi:hypothetical protein